MARCALKRQAAAIAESEAQRVASETHRSSLGLQLHAGLQAGLGPPPKLLATAARLMGDVVGSSGGSQAAQQARHRRHVSNIAMSAASPRQQHRHVSSIAWPSELTDQPAPSCNAPT